ncbi:hypothetical protein WJX74_009433 [Apatococcus lobatus]|uniref:Uncharacterized protein n=1 Tax=Apatococcus lobatus TaxID=904363 RepID=A0AAW1RCG1_9CHLO
MRARGGARGSSVTGERRFDGIDIKEALPCICDARAESNLKAHFRKQGRLMEGVRGLSCDTELFWCDGTQKDWNEVVETAQAIIRDVDAQTKEGRETKHLELQLAIEREKTAQAQLLTGRKRQFDEIAMQPPLSIEWQP